MQLSLDLGCQLKRRCINRTPASPPRLEGLPWVTAQSTFRNNESGSKLCQLNGHCIAHSCTLQYISLSDLQVPDVHLITRATGPTSGCLAPVNCITRRRLPFRSLEGLPTPSVAGNSAYTRVPQYRTSVDRDLPELLLHLVQLGKVATAATLTQPTRPRSARLPSPMCCTLRTQLAAQVCIIFVSADRQHT